MSGSELKRIADEYVAACRVKRTAPHVSELAANLDVSVSKLSNWFLDEMGVRPAAYLKAEDAHFVIEQIQTTELDYDSIAKMIGCTRTTLFRTIRRITGRTPDSFRTHRVQRSR